MLISSNETKLIKESEADKEQREKKERKIRREKKKVERMQPTGQ